MAFDTIEHCIRTQHAPLFALLQQQFVLVAVFRHAFSAVNGFITLVLFMGDLSRLPFYAYKNIFSGRLHQYQDEIDLCTFLHILDIRTYQSASHLASALSHIVQTNLFKHVYVQSNNMTTSQCDQLKLVSYLAPLIIWFSLFSYNVSEQPFSLCLCMSKCNKLEVIFSFRKKFVRSSIFKLILSDPDFHGIADLSSACSLLCRP